MWSCLVWACIVAPSFFFGVTQTCGTCEGGVLAVALSHMATIVYEVLRVVRLKPNNNTISWIQVQSHLSQPEGFFLLFCYLFGTWYLRMLPGSYYETQGRGFRIHFVFFQLVVQDFYQYLMHRLQHLFKMKSHRAHHRHHSPSFWDSFDGSKADTFLMILIPLLATAHTVPWCNVYDYMCFGSVYANWLCLIHSNAGPHVWDGGFQRWYLGTPRDHHIHHRDPTRNFGHLFQWWP